MKLIFHAAENRGTKDIGWLHSNFSFSFSSFYNPVKTGFGLLRTLNDDIVQPDKGFGLHPHTNMEIISIILKGNMNHKDSMGYSDEVGEDWVQIMSAGSGLRHEEYNIGKEEVNFLQIWIEPKLQNISPRYQRRHFPKEERKNRLQVIISNQEGTEHCWINQNATLSLGYFDAGETTVYPFNPLNKCVYVFCIEGEIRVEEQAMKRRDGIGLWETPDIRIRCSTEAQFLIIEVPVNQ